jgi:hypothetical protein
LLRLPAGRPKPWKDGKTEDFGAESAAERVGRPTRLKWDYNLEIDDGEGALSQAGGDGSGGRRPVLPEHGQQHA